MTVASRYFGDDLDAIAVHFHNGASIVAGYIIEQIGLNRYQVSDGRVEKLVTLAATETQVRILLGELEISPQYPASLVASVATIVARNETDVARLTRLATLQAMTISGASIAWTADAGDGYQIETIGYVAANKADGSLSFNKMGNSSLLAFL